MRSLVWEAELAYQFEKENIPYNNEISFDTPNGEYSPSFVFPGNLVLDVIWESNNEDIFKVKSFDINFPDWNLIVVGQELPSNKHYTKEDRHDVVDLVSKYIMS